MEVVCLFWSLSKILLLAFVATVILLVRKTVCAGMFRTLAKSSDAFPHWVKNDESPEDRSD